MAEYESIHGTKVKYLSSDPTLDSTTEGQVWYNSTSGTNKSLVQFKAWAAGGFLPTATNNNGSATQGTQTASLSFGGGATTSQTIEYDGYAWATGGNLGTPRYVLSGAGVQTAALGFGGYQHPPGVFKDSTEEYDGSSWTGGGALSNARGSMGGNGTQTAAIAVTGAPLSPGTQSEEYNGSSWTAGGAYPVAQQSIAVAGPQTAALGAGGISGGPENGSTLVTNYDGSSWTVVSGTIPNGQNRAATAGGQTHAVVFGGNINTPPPAGPGTPGIVTTATNEWDGSTFTITANMATARQSYAGAGTATSAIGFGGDKNPGASNDTEEYNSAITQVGAGVWAAGGNLSTARGGTNTSYGTQTAALMTGGERTPGGAMGTEVEEYGGTSWTSGGAIPTATGGMGGGGPQTAAIMMGGNTPGDNRVKTDYDYNGSSWTANPDMPQISGATRGFGTQTAAICIGGNQNPGNNTHKKTMEFNGSSWSDGGDYPVNHTPNAGIVNLMGFGTQTAAVGAGGQHGNGFGSSNQLNTNIYDGSSWTAGNNLQSLALFGGAFGTQGGGIISGYAPPPVGLTTTQRWDGNGWTTTTSNSVGSQGKGAAGDLSSGLIIGGIFAPSSPNSPNWGEIANTEEWTGDSVIAAVASTLTTS